MWCCSRVEILESSVVVAATELKYRTDEEERANGELSTFLSSGLWPVGLTAPRPSGGICVREGERRVREELWPLGEDQASIPSSSSFCDVYTAAGWMTL